jgi:ADP-ribosylglycohydrolase
MLISGWDTPLALAKAEATQRSYEGCVVPLEVTEALGKLESAYSDDALGALLQALAALKPEAAFQYDQPEDLDAIYAQRRSGPRRLRLALSDTELLDRFHGAWTGRAVGCALGKPVELLGMFGDGQRNGRASIEALLKSRGDWPLRDYVSGAEQAESRLFCPLSWRENIAFLEADDDIHYSLIALHVLERFGENFEWNDIANAWNDLLPYSSICTAETQAILNYNLSSARTQISRGRRDDISPEFTRRHNNPYREWIGAQIRADVWGYACAGEPERAAALAWRDASWTHTANGVYAAMMTAAMVASAFVESDPKRLVEIGLSEIPNNCRLAEAVRQATRWFDECGDSESFMIRHEQTFATLHPTHAVNNALVVIMALHYGCGDLDRTVATAVMAGLDTDSNAATAGSIVGAMIGKARLKSALEARLNDTIKPHLCGVEAVHMNGLAARTAKVHETLRHGK